MKNALLLFLLLYFPGSAFAQTNCGFSVYSGNGKKFTLIANGIKQNATPAAQVKVLNLPTDVVKVQIRWADGSLQNVEKTLHLRLNELEYYQLKQKPDKQFRLVYVRAEELPEMAWRQPSGKAGISKQKNDCGKSASHGTRSHSTHCSGPESRYAVYSILETIRSESFESDKLKRAKEAVLNGCLAAEQIAQLLTGFTYESTRLKFAKFAYAYAHNPGNYMAVARGFEYMSSKNELEKFIWAQQP